MKTPGLQRPFRSRRLCRAVACAPGIPAKGRRDVRRNAVSQTALHVVAAGPCPLLCPLPFTCLSPCRRGHRQPQPSPPVQGEMHIPPNFLPRSRQKLLRSAPGQSFPAVAVMPLAAKVLKQVMVNTGGNKEQVPAKRQNRGSRNSTDDGAENQREEKAG